MAASENSCAELRELDYPGVYTQKALPSAVQEPKTESDMQLSDPTPDLCKLDFHLNRTPR